MCIINVMTIIILILMCNNNNVIILIMMCVNINVCNDISNNDNMCMTIINVK